MSESKVTPEEFAKKYRELFDMSAKIDGIRKVHFRIDTYGDQVVCDKIKALVDFETAEAQLKRIEEQGF